MLSDKKRICADCGANSDATPFLPGRNQCRACKRQYNREYRIKNSAHIKARLKAYRAANKARLAAIRLENYKKNKDVLLSRNRKYRSTDRGKAYRREYRRKNTQLFAAYAEKARYNLSDAYVRQILTQRAALTAADIPIELVELKRAEIKLKRTIEEVENG